MNEMRHIVVQIWKSNTVFRSHWLSDDHLVDVIEFVPIIVTANELKKQNGNKSEIYCSTQPVCATHPML